MIVFRDGRTMRLSYNLGRIGVGCLIFVSGIICQAGERTTGFARAPYIQFSTTNSIYVVWRTEGPITPVVRFGTGLDRLESEVSYVSETSGTGIVVRVALGADNRSIPEKWKKYRTEENLKLRKLHSAP